MNQKISEKQIEAILNLDAKKRFEHTIKQIVGWDILWILYFEEKISLEREENKCGYIWPAEEYIDIFLSNKRVFGEKEKLKLDVFLEEIAPNLIEKNSYLSIFPTLNDEGYLISCKNFYDDLLIELDNY